MLNLKKKLNNSINQKIKKTKKKLTKMSEKDKKSKATSSAAVAIGSTDEEDENKSNRSSQPELVNQSYSSGSLMPSVSNLTKLFLENQKKLRETPKQYESLSMGLNAKQLAKYFDEKQKEAVKSVRGGTSSRQRSQRLDSPRPSSLVYKGLRQANELMDMLKPDSDESLVKTETETTSSVTSLSAASSSTTVVATSASSTSTTTSTRTDDTITNEKTCEISNSFNKLI